MNRKLLTNSKGFTLIELLVSFVILSIFLSVVGSALQNSFVQNTSADNKLNSIYIAKNTLEYYQDKSIEEIENIIGKKVDKCPNPNTISKTETLIYEKSVNPDDFITLSANERDKYNITAKFARYCISSKTPTNELYLDKIIDINISVETSVNGKGKKYDKIEGFWRNEAQ